jgi:hypothetical protein
MMNNEDLADILIERLNDLCHDPEVRKDIAKLIEMRVPCTKAMVDHPTVQTQDQTGQEIPLLHEVFGPALAKMLEGTQGPVVGFLGLLNGLVGIIPDGRLKGWGYIAAVYDDDQNLTHFRRSDKP